MPEQKRNRGATVNLLTFKGLLNLWRDESRQMTALDIAVLTHDLSKNFTSAARARARGSVLLQNAGARGGIDRGDALRVVGIR
jgi:hypothetical protein